MISNIIDQFEYNVKAAPHAIAVSFEDRCWTYSQLNNYANFVAHMLAEFGVKEYSVVAVSGIKSFEMIAAIIAILKLKGSYMPLDLSLPSERIQAMLKNASVQHIVSQGIKGCNNKYDATICINLNYAEFDEAIEYPNLNKIISSNDPVYIMHTSGSTGIPKGVVVPHRAVIRLLINTNYILINSFDSILFHSNTSFDAAIFEIWAALLNGAQIVISPYLVGDINSIFKLCKDRNITILLLATGLFHIFANLELSELPQLRYLVVGGDVMHANAAVKVIKKNKTLKIINGYGPAENTVFTTCLIIQSEDDINIPVSIGKPISGTQVYLLDETFNEVKEGEVGELYTSGIGVALGYINDLELTQKKFMKLPHIAGDEVVYRTGDLAKILPSGNYQFVGRRDNQVKIRGFRVELTEIEHLISNLNFVEDVCVCIVEQQNRKLAAYVKVNDDYYSHYKNDKATIVSFLERKLPSYCIPSYIEVNNVFPLTSNGKIDRKLLQDRLNKMSEVY